MTEVEEQVQPALPIALGDPPAKPDAAPDVDFESLHTPVQEIFIPIWHQVRLSRAEMQLLDHPAFCRLSNIYQLGQTHLVFRGATHRRWEHALGTLQASQMFISAIRRSHEISEVKGIDPRVGGWRRAVPFHRHEEVLIRMGALLHDLGHVAAGHTFEDELGLLEKHDADDRLDHILKKTEWGGSQVEPLRHLLNTLYSEPARLTESGLTASELLLELVSKTRSDPERRDPLQDTPQLRIRAARDVIGNTICADLLDYIHRDWHHLGKPRPVDERLLDYFELRENDAPDGQGKTSLVVYLREGSNVRNDAVTAIFELLESRYQLGEVALFHRTKLTAAAMLERLVAEIADAAEDRGWFANQLDAILECTDEELLEFLLREGRHLVAASKSPVRKKRLEATLGMVRRLRYRQLHKQVLAFGAHDLGPNIAWVRQTLGGEAGAQQRLNDCRSLEEDFHLTPGSVVIYCPGKAPHAKIAGVQVLANGQVSALHQLEDPGSVDPRMTSGILRAQLDRFDRLWRVQVSVSAEALENLAEQNTLGIFLHTVEWLVLRADRSGTPVESAAHELAGMLVNNPLYDTKGKQLVAVGETHARTRSGGVKTYGSGASTLSSLLIPAAD